MKKSVSAPNIRRNVSANALPDLNVIDAMVITKAPIHHSAQCITTSEFPEHIISGNLNKEFMHCLVTPYDPPEERQRPLYSANNQESLQEKYAEWLRRIRRSRRYSSN